MELRYSTDAAVMAAEEKMPKTPQRQEPQKSQIDADMFMYDVYFT